MIAAFQRLEPRRRRTVMVILLLGLGSALAVLLTAAPQDPDDYQIERTKAYVREMETYGGKSNLLATDLREWLATLWHGERLAATMAVLTFVVLFLYLLGSREPYARAPRRMPRAVPREPEDTGDEDSTGGAG
jgi:multisubunit Na+/H+ antiporter MnhB subunit